MKYYIIAGEASGDLHGSNLMKEIAKFDSKADFRCWGGDLMELAGGKLVKHYRDLAFMGFVEVLANISTIMSNLKFCRNDIINYKPDVIILIDYPGFNLRIAQFAKRNNFKVVYYISPQVWAWKRNRVYKIKNNVDKMIVILPFEKEFYKEYNYEVEFVGHPLLDALQNGNNFSKEDFYSRNNLDNKPIVALLPGSRKQEVNKMLRKMLLLSDHYSNYQFLIAGVSNLSDEFYSKVIGKKDVKIIKGQTHNIIRYADAALVTSGTATLETALIGTPEVVCYEGSIISYEIARRIVKVKYISLVNLIMDAEVVKELIQKDFNYNNLKNELNKLLFDEDYKNKMNDNFNKLRTKLGNSGASEKAAKIVHEVACGS